MKIEIQQAGIAGIPSDERKTKIEGSEFIPAFDMDKQMLFGGAKHRYLFL